MKIKPDFSQAKEANYTELAEGEYCARISKYEPKKFKSGADGVLFTLEIFNCEIPDFNGYRVLHQTPINGAGANIFKQFACAVYPEYASGEVNLDDMEGKEIEIFVKLEEYNGKRYPRVKGVKPYVGDNVDFGDLKF